MVMTPRPTPRFTRAAIAPWLDRRLVELTRLCAVGVAGVLGAIALVIIWQARPAIAQLGFSFLWQREWNPVAGREAYGALPLIYGTLMTALIALGLAVPVGLGTALCLSEDWLPRWLRLIFTFGVELLAAIPSVVYGLWGIFVVLPRLRGVGNWLHVHWGAVPLFSAPASGPGLLPAGVVLAIMILPIIAAIARDSLAALPPELRQASLSLGATRWETLLRVLLPAAASGIGGGIMLALGRALGETMAVTMLIGNAHQISPALFAPASTIASLLANQFSEAQGLQVAALMYAALVLLGMTLLVNILAVAIVQGVRSRAG